MHLGKIVKFIYQVFIPIWHTNWVKQILRALTAYLNNKLSTQLKHLCRKFVFAADLSLKKHVWNKDMAFINLQRQ